MLHSVLLLLLENSLKYYHFLFFIFKKTFTENKENEDTCNLGDNQIPNLANSQIISPNLSHPAEKKFEPQSVLKKVYELR
jgi:hypothetical protein